ncbi:PASTA domain-containing protein [Halalkalibacter okhensis]|uniref:PASTA domain-containing protein n=1 Tax=Halalkalibacter okhensis TaxID=333138 RepID=UPI001F43CBD9|nr:PASTA domain-containing protein [Halalkalibacter okhensis]
MLILGGAIAAFAVFPTIFQVGEVEVPSVVDRSFEEAEEELTSLKLVVVREEIEDSEISENHVVRQNPRPGSMVKEGSTVRLFVSQGKEEVELDDVVGMHIDRAASHLRGQGYKVETTEQETDEESPDYVILQEPEPGTMVIVDETTIHLTYSVAPSIRLRDLENVRESEAISYLDDIELTHNLSYEHSDTIESGRVLRQSPSPNTEVEKGQSVSLTISRGPEPEPEPEPEPVYNYEVRQEIQMSTEEREAGQSFDIRIVYRDHTTGGQEEVYEDETITDTKLYSIPLVTSPSQNGYIKIFIDGELEKDLGPYEFRQRN